MAADNNNVLENIYQFLGLEDFEDDQVKIQAAFDNIEQVYGVGGRLVREKGDVSGIEVSDHLQQVFPALEEDQIKDFLSYIDRRLHAYKAVLLDPQPKANYDNILRDTEYLQQPKSEYVSYAGALGRNFAPDTLSNDLGNSFNDYLKDQYLKGREYMLGDGLNAQELSDLLNKWMVLYHKYAYDILQNSADPSFTPQQLLEDKTADKQKLLDAIRFPQLPSTALAVQNASCMQQKQLPAPIKQTQLALWEERAQGVEPYVHDGEFIPKQSEQDDFDPDAPRIETDPIDGEVERKELPYEEQVNEEESDLDDDDPNATRDDEPPQDLLCHDDEVQQDKVQQDFQKTARQLMVYPEGGLKNKALLNLPMSFLQSENADYGDVELHVMTGIEGQKYMFGNDNNLSIGGRLKVDGYALHHNDRPAERVAVWGQMNIKCNGGFFDGGIDGRQRTTKVGKGKAKDAEGNIVEVPTYKHSYSKKRAEIVIDAGNEDVIINGDITGKVRIKTTGKVQVVGNIDGDVIIDTAQGIEVTGNVSGAACLRSHANVAILGKMARSVKTSPKTAGAGHEIPPEQLAQIRADVREQENPTEKPEPEDQEAKLDTATAKAAQQTI